VKRPQGRSTGSAKAEDTGNATATDESSNAVSRIDYN
jgi:hypothetical protein